MSNIRQLWPYAYWSIEDFPFRRLCRTADGWDSGRISSGFYPGLQDKDGTSTGDLIPDNYPRLIQDYPGWIGAYISCTVNQNEYPSLNSNPFAYSMAGPRDILDASGIINEPRVHKATEKRHRSYVQESGQ